MECCKLLVTGLLKFTKGYVQILVLEARIFSLRSKCRLITVLPYQILQKFNKFLYPGCPPQVADFAKPRADTFPRLLWKDTAPQHFDNPPYGYYEAGSRSAYKDCVATGVTLQDDGSLQASQDGLGVLLEGGKELT